jgi:hypothetical protein
MIDLKPEVYGALRTLGIPVTDAFPAGFRDLPCLSFYELSNTDHYKVDGELLTEVTYQVDIWSDGSTGDLALRVDEALTEIGLRRQYAADVPQAGIKHKTMRYGGLVEPRSGLVYQL